MARRRVRGELHERLVSLWGLPSFGWGGSSELLGPALIARLWTTPTLICPIGLNNGLPTGIFERDTVHPRFVADGEFRATQPGSDLTGGESLLCKTAQSANIFH